MNARGALLILTIVVLALASAFMMYRDAPSAAPELLPPSSTDVRDDEFAPAPAGRVTEPVEPQRTAQESATPAADGQFEVRVIDVTTGEPVTEYEVAFLDHVPGDRAAWIVTQNNPTLTWHAVSDTGGRSAWPRSRLDDAEALGVRAEGYAPQWKELRLYEEFIEIELAPAAVLQGRVIDRNALPVEGASVTVAERSVDTDADGRFQIAGLPEGAVTVVSEHSQFQPEQVALMLTAGKVHDVQMVLDRGGAIVGSVVEQRAPVQNAKVVAMRSDDVGTHRETTTEADGTFRIEGVGPGEWRVMAVLTETDTASELHQRALVEDGRETTLEFVFGEPVLVEGAVVAGEAPAVGALIRARSVEGSEEQFVDARSDDTGWYQIEVMPGTVQLIAEHPEDQSRRKTTVLTVASGPVEYDFIFEAPVPFSGRVSGTAPDESVNVYVMPVGYMVDVTSATWGMDLMRTALAQTTADPSGVFAINSLESGTYSLAIVAFDPEPSEGRDPLSTARLLERDIDIQSGGAHIELGF